MCGEPAHRKRRFFRLRNEFIISANLKRPESERVEHWFIYGTLDQWVCDAIAKYPIRGQSVVNMG
jgi:hypothetical protein